MEEQVIEQQSRAQRVTPADVEAEIASEWYINGATGVVPDEFQPPVPAGHPLDMLTICVLILRNGAIDPARHDAERGRRDARAQAVEKVWELLGFRLRDQLATS